MGPGRYNSRPMQLIRGLHNLRAGHRPSVVAIGNYDGLHVGHRSILGRLRELAGPARSTLVTFEPMPREFFAPASAPPRLARLAETIELLREQSLVDQLLCLRFDAALAAMTPEAFVQRVLVEGLAARHVVVGEDFRYGAKRAGDIDSLRQAGRQHGFAVEVATTVCAAQQRVSSTRVRQALQAGEVVRANEMLGRPYLVTGHVQHGQKMGRTIGFPTANLRLRRRPALRAGVYAVRMRVQGQDNWHNAVANFGTRPTVSGQGQLLEVHCLEGQPELYGRRLWVEFLDFLRPEQRFEGLDALKSQIERDVATARRCLE